MKRTFGLLSVAVVLTPCQEQTTTTTTPRAAQPEAPLEEIKLSGMIKQENATSAPLTNGWVNYGNSTINPQYYKDKEGTVHIEGHASHPLPIIAGEIFELPTGYRPSGNMRFLVPSSVGVSQVTINASTGKVNLEPGSSLTWISLDNIGFRSN